MSAFEKLKGDDAVMDNIGGIQEMIHIPVYFIENRWDIIEKRARQSHGKFGEI